MKRATRALFALLLLVAVAAAGGLVWARRELATPRAFGSPGAGTTFVVERGESSRTILARLESAGLIRSALLARLYLSRVEGDPSLAAGEYRFVSPISTLELLGKLRRGEVATYPVTIVEGLTYFETAAALAAAGFGPEAELRTELARPERVRDLDPLATTLEGFLFPDTYRFPRGVSPQAIADAMVAEFRRRFERAVAPLRPPADARSVRELVIVASLVEKEARRDEERPLVAAVYANRLRIGMGLYADPTLIYGRKLAGTWDGNLRRRDLEDDNAWNTYRRPGLPPGPICSPGLASLAAAARPATVDYLYFVSRNDGSHVFSDNLKEHNRNVERWQRRYFRDHKQGGGGARGAN
jgi:peptidoglycan lytic transglycosylase G